ncbi:MAG: 2-succinyl-5-enolpyruvyl-6-hydroxy-3-cyclohexene-1-carboxylic-acid synthase [Nocardioidaceae bacterium]|nr:2-succinyl-5-enolpyruvyl-6-hydroxy-3-cyclohexene-1-carboxylic-acid synthase [Nocardioidaceae bacterium]
MNGSTSTALAVVSALRRGNVADVVLAPGSRSAALALAFQQADVAGVLRLHVRIDERTAGFLALGLSKGSHRPAAVVTTSGTAVANLHPAVLEASHAGVPLLVLSADRPASLRGTGANQTTEQAGLFGGRVLCVDVAPDDAVGAADAIDDAVRRHGPTQVNLQFADPLLPESLPLDFGEETADTALLSRRQLAAPDGSERLGLGPRTVVVAGDDAGPPARLLAQGANWPLLAEPTSGARTGSHALRTYRLLLDSDLGKQVERVVVTGHPTLSRQATRLISRSDIEVVSVRGPGGVCTDPGLVARHVDTVPVVDGADGEMWISSWREADGRQSLAVDALAAEPEGLPLRVAAEVAAAVPAGGLLVVGSSQPIRDLDVMAPPYPAGQRRLVIGNRGLSGIDGTLSTAIGAALGRRSARSLAYVGDLTFLHDSNALVIGPDEPRPDLTIVVANDDGGAIFATLEQGAAAYGVAFERVFGTPHGVSVQTLCAATGTTYERVDDAAALRDVLTQSARGIKVLEVPISRAHRRSLADRLRGLAR